MSEPPLVQVALREEQFHLFSFLFSFLLQGIIVYHLHYEVMTRFCPLYYLLSLVPSGARILHSATAVLDAADKPSYYSLWISHACNTPYNEHLG